MHLNSNKYVYLNYDRNGSVNLTFVSEFIKESIRARCIEINKVKTFKPDRGIFPPSRKVIWVNELKLKNTTH